MNKDLLVRPYGRFYYLAKYLASYGHEVYFMLLNYKNEPRQYSDFSNIKWTSISIYDRFGYSYYHEIKKIIESTKPDWILGFSDTYFGILANRLANKYQFSCLIDAYDNYESYIPWLKPLHLLWRKALTQATLVTTAGPALAELIGQYRSQKPTIVIPMAADPEFTRSLNKTKCRETLDFSPNIKLVGYCGGIHNNRGIKYLFKAFDIVKQQKPDIEFVVSGRLFPSIKIPDYVRWVGYLNEEQMPCLIRSLDLLVSVNLESAFGNYSYPVKIYEAIQSGTAVIATSTKSTQWILADQPNLLFQPASAISIAEKILEILSTEHTPIEDKHGWVTHARKLEQHMLKSLD